MFPTLNNIAKPRQDLHQKSESRMTNTEDIINIIKLTRNTKIEIQENIKSIKEEILESVKEGIEKLVDSRNRELEDRERRALNLTIFYLPKQNTADGAANKQADEWDFKNICPKLRLEAVNIVTCFRLGRRRENTTRPLKVIQSYKLQKFHLGQCQTN